MLQVSQDVRAVPLGADGPVPALPTERGGLQLRLGTWRAGVGSGEGLKSIRKIKGINKVAIKVFSTPILKYQNFKTSLLFFKIAQGPPPGEPGVFWFSLFSLSQVALALDHLATVPLLWPKSC